EKAPFKKPTGACGCCGMRALAGPGKHLYALFRSASLGVHRDTYLLTSNDRGDAFEGENLGKWNAGACPMSTYTLAHAPAGVLAAWETTGQVYYTLLDPKTGKRSPTVAAPGAGSGRKHPSVAGNARGEVLLAWTEGMGWNKGGSLAWQVFDRHGKLRG